MKTTPRKAVVKKWPKNWISGLELRWCVLAKEGNNTQLLAACAGPTDAKLVAEALNSTSARKTSVAEVILAKWWKIPPAKAVKLPKRKTEA